MSLSRLLLSERLAKRSAPPQMPPGLTGMAALLYIAETGGFEDLVRAAAKSGPPLVMDPRPPPELPAPEASPSAEATAAPTLPVPEPQPEPPLQWWEELCRFRARTAADDYDDAETSDEDDDPLGLYS